MDHTSNPPAAGADGEHRSPEANAWESRLLALNALVELAREHAVGRSTPGDRSYRLEHALTRVRQAVAAPGTQERETVEAAVSAFGETLASLAARTGQRP